MQIVRNLTWLPGLVRGLRLSTTSQEVIGADGQQIFVVFKVSFLKHAACREFILFSKRSAFCHL